MNISRTARNVVACVFLLLSVLLGTIAMVGSKAVELIDTPEPLQRILVPLAVDPALRQALPKELSATLSAQITEEISLPSIFLIPLEKATTIAAGALLDTPSFAASWEQTVETSRADFVSRLDAAAAAPEGTEQVSLRLDVAPLVGSGYEALHSSLAGSRLGALLPNTLDIPPAVLDTGWPQASHLPTETLNSWLALARGWGWFAAGAVLAAILGLRSGIGAGRRTAVLIAGAAAVVLGGIVRASFTSRLSTGTQDASAQGASVESLVTTALITGLRSELGSITTILIGGGVVVVLGSIGWLWARSKVVDAPRAG
ncbi:MAG: hypothetical protein ABWX89_09675 [Paeniglutamicibacter terrestris]